MKYLAIAFLIVHANVAAALAEATAPSRRELAAEAAASGNHDQAIALLTSQLETDASDYRARVMLFIELMRIADEPRARAQASLLRASNAPPDVIARVESLLRRHDGAAQGSVAAEFWSLPAEDRELVLAEGVAAAKQSDAPFSIVPLVNRRQEIALYSPLYDFVADSDPAIEAQRAAILGTTSKSARDQLERYNKNTEMIEKATASMKQQQALLPKAPNPNLTAEQQAYFEKWKASQEVSAASSSAFNSSYQQQLATGRVRETQARLELVVKASESWEAPKAYVAAAPASSIKIDDPFASQASTSPALEQLSAALAGSCLGVDATRGTALVTGTCEGACLGTARSGDLPVLARGSFVSDAESAREFLESCLAGEAATVLRDGMWLVVLRNQ